MRTTPKGLIVWDDEDDRFNHAQHAANIDLIDSLLGSSAKSVEVLSAVPTTGNFAGRLVMLSNPTANGEFAAWSLIRYDGSAWRAVNLEIVPAVPTAGLYAGRVVVLSAASGAFQAWDVLRYDGTQWDILGGWRNVNTGNNPNNIQGVQILGDAHVSQGTRGLVLTDRTTGVKRRIYLDNGDIHTEVVS